MAKHQGSVSGIDPDAAFNTPGGTAGLAPWASNLLPEGAQLRAVGLTLGAAPEDVIGILSEVGRDTAGALSIGQPGSTNPGDWRPIGAPERS